MARGVDEAYGLIHHGCGGSVLSVCVSRASHGISTAFRERHFRPVEMVKGSLSDADWVRLKKLVEKAPSGKCRSDTTTAASTALIGRLKAETTMAITHRSAGRHAVAHSAAGGILRFAASA
jgi:hypothetical protein